VDTIKKDEPYQAKGTEASWYKGWNLTDEERARFRRTTLASQAAKAKAVRGDCSAPKHPVPVPRLMAEQLMPVRPPNTLRVLSLFSGGGGLDIGFDRAGFEHLASYEIREDAATVLRAAKKQWTVYGGVDGDVCHVNWEQYKGTVDVLHGGPPCQPFSHAGYQSGENDVRDMFPQLVRAVQSVEPLVFVAENVPGLSSKKFSQYLQKTIIRSAGRQIQHPNVYVGSCQFRRSSAPPPGMVCWISKSNRRKQVPDTRRNSHTRPGTRRQAAFRRSSSDDGSP
jgi:DNA (cytosine-5)-methyltransferase 1